LNGEVKQIGNLTENSKRENPQTYRVYDKEGISPTLNCMQGGNLQPMIIEDFYKNREPRVYDETAPTIRAEREGLKVIEDYIMPGNNFNQCNKVHSENGICRTIIGQGHAGNEPKVIVASRGRNPENPSDRKQGIELEQRLEPNSEGICNTLTSVQKDNLVLEPLNPMPDGTCRTIKNQYFKNSIQNFDSQGTFGATGVVAIKQATQQGYAECKLGGVADLSFPTSKTRRGRVQDGGDTYPTLTASETSVHRIESPYRIRKLTPKECAKLMKFSDEDANKMLEVNSNTQVYKQCGNSIVVSVLEAIFCQMNIKGCPTWEEQSKKYL
jgi:site-specific DNA-cytosine methylase